MALALSSSASNSILTLQERYRLGETTPAREVKAALAKANSNAGKNVYLALDADATIERARDLPHDTIAQQPLWGVPVSLKDCFDLEGFATSCGSTFYRDLYGIAAEDSEVARRLLVAGALITGKTHLHQLAYGITGENHDFGDCVQPRDATLLTGGSSSGAAASVQEGSALAAIGTDTGGSIRVPAALCGLCGYRSSITLNTPELWRGGAHLAATFDTLGWLYRHAADGPLLGHALFGLDMPSAPEIASLRIGIPDAAFLHDCEPGVLSAVQDWEARLIALGTQLSRFDASPWNEAFEIFAPIQASEAAALHRGHFQHFEPSIAERLAWGESLTAADLAFQRHRLETFRATTTTLFQSFDYLLLPCTPVTAIRRGEDHSAVRAQMLRYTAPMSLCGLPVVALPCGQAGGMQIVGPLNSDAALLALSVALAES